jgi:hypothetical protein
MAGRGSIPGRGKMFSLLHNIHISSGAHPTSNLVCTGVMRPDRKTDHCPPSSVEIKNGEI